MSVPAAEAVNALGKELPPADTRSAEEVDNRDPFDHAKMNDILSDPSKLEGKTEAEIAALMGVSEYDRSTEAAPEGDATVHELARRQDQAQAAPAPVAAAPAAAPAPATPTPPAAAAAAEAAVKAVAAGAAAPAAAEPEPVIETRDGQPRIKYSVLQAERRANRDLRELTTRQEAELAALRAGQPAPVAAAPIEEAAPVEIDPANVRLYTTDEIAKFREDYPANLVDRWVADNQAAVATYHTVVNDRAERERDKNNLAQQNVIDFTDEHPLLSGWAAGETEQDQALFKACVIQDRVLRADPEWAARPWQERMEQAVVNTARINGIEYTQGGAPSPTPTPQPSLQERAQARLAQAAAAPVLPTSHSDLPPGAPAGSSERDTLTSMSPHQLEAKLEKMTPAQMEKYLADVA